ncbi:hypothetical protein [Citrobacter phage Ci1]|nr:hypothetical protein [Citrobacter phage Ci1]
MRNFVFHKVVIGILCVVALFVSINASLELHIGPEVHEKSTIEDARMSL